MVQNFLQFLTTVIKLEYQCLSTVVVVELCGDYWWYCDRQTKQSGLFKQNAIRPDIGFILGNEVVWGLKTQSVSHFFFSILTASLSEKKDLFELTFTILTKSYQKSDILLTPRSWKYFYLLFLW